MKRFVIERSLPGAENLSAEELREISLAWCEASNHLGKADIWVQSFIGRDKIFCLHYAESEEIIREHSRIAKFPINNISEIKMILDPTASTT